MENKYTYYKPKNSEMMANVYFNKLVVAHFESEKDAQEYIDWKNANELKSDPDVIEHEKMFNDAVNEYNNKPKIDKDFKEQMINHFKLESCKDLDDNSWINKQYQLLINAIENLPTE